MSAHAVGALATVLITILVLLIGLQLRAWNGTVNADGISYIELGGQYADGDVSALANGYWSPLYPLLLGTAFRVAGRPMLDLSGSVITRELRVVLAVNLAVVGIATVLYARLVNALDQCDGSHTSLGIRLGRFAAAGSLWTWWIVRFSIATTTTPDLLLAACLAAVLTELVIGTTHPSTWGAIRLGIALGLGFWTKAVFFLVIPVAAIAYLLLVPRGMWRRHAPLLLTTVGLLSAPLIIVQSTTQGRFSFGETGRLNYAWYVNEVPRAVPIVELRAKSRARHDRPRIVQMDAAPGIVLYAGQSVASFPYWYDPARYESSARPTLSLANQWRTLKANGRWFRVVGGAFTVTCLVALGISSRRMRLSPRHIIVALPALALTGLYALTHPEGRLAGSAIVCCLAMVVYWRGTSRDTPSIRRIVSSEASILLLLPLLVGLRLRSQDFLREQAASLRPGRDLIQAGIRHGSQIGLLGSPFGQYWVHQLGLRIAVAGELTEDSGPPDSELLGRIADESCERGAPLAAILWRETQATQVRDVVELTGGWLAWRPPHSCAMHDAAPANKRSP